ncbi:Dipeptide/tripeptide permease [Mariniphaga anaerophila]|uniref:Dipeptide/tripeptide permease n=1 Tax=Mariniphaga anaerophila TaxID=1484053 RepID=A0A1M5BQU0_9BACT|nr:MFS transporter [Mariniphaga anaerophila]SHF44918.1 Dipeptide/tripeptide permease [Mariniphaga anaerophila]
MGFVSVIKKYNTTFWASNVIELFERWAWYGFYMAFALYLVNSKDTGALGLTQAQKGIIMGTGSMLLYFLPVITGAIADKVGYKRILFLSFTIYITGFYMIGSFETFGWMFFAFIWTCIGGALFKPIISAMVARNTTEETSSIGFGIFYMMINIGGFIGPFIAGVLMQKSWDFVFHMSIIAMAVNYFVTAFFFREPVVKEEGGSLGKSIVQAFVNIGITLRNWKYVLFLIIMVLFWTAFNQLYYSFPVFVDQWIDTSALYNGIHSVWPWLAEAIGTPQGTITAVTLGSMDAFFIIVFQLVVSAFVMRFRPLAAMMGGILVLAGGLGLMFSNQSSWLILLGILVFALGEMASSPKFTEYVGRIAPEDKKALYMGTSFLPIAAGHQLAGWLSGGVYERIADDLFLLKKEVALRGISLPEISAEFTKNDYIAMAAEKMGMTGQELTNFLWTNYNPSDIWMVYAGVAVMAVVFLWIYDRFVLGK